MKLDPNGIDFSKRGYVKFALRLYMIFKYVKVHEARISIDSATSREM